ncbi:MAG: histidine kinase, partial [Deltaproteobacteria bacterium]|nr:histidine kinase [Deltaproteobacteria bacterium]
NFDFSGDSAGVLIDEDKLRQVFINLFSNASDAMEAKGVLIVKTSLERIGLNEDEDGEVRGGAIAKRAERAREFVAISFMDNGPGVPAEDMEKIFDPFFTTKEAGHGTGLGLFVSESIIKAFGGMIEVANRPEGGTEFKVLILREDRGV